MFLSQSYTNDYMHPVLYIYKTYSAVANKTLSLKIQWQKVVKSNSQCSKTSLLSPVMLQRCYAVKQCAVGGPDAWWQANSEPNPQI